MAESSSDFSPFASEKCSACALAVKKLESGSSQRVPASHPDRPIRPGSQKLDIVTAQAVLGGIAGPMTSFQLEETMRASHPQPASRIEQDLTGFFARQADLRHQTVKCWRTIVSAPESSTSRQNPEPALRIRHQLDDPILARAGAELVATDSSRVEALAWPTRRERCQSRWLHRT